MSDSRLTSYYQSKYAHEADADAMQNVGLVDHPVGRFEGAVAALAPRIDGKDVLELGAGAGNMVQSLLRIGASPASWTLTDFATNRVDGMRRRLGGDARLRFEVVDASEPTVAFSDQRFDVIVYMALIEHVVDPINAMSETRALLRPGGFCYIETPNVAKWSRRIKLALGQFPSTASRQEGLVTYDGGPVAMHDEGHLHYFTYRSLERMLVERCGFTRVETAPYAADRRPSAVTASRLARRWPAMFADISVLAYA